MGRDTTADPDPFGAAIDQVNDAAARAEYAMALTEQEASAIMADRDQIQANKDGVAQLDTSVSALQAANVRYSSRFSNALIGHATGSGTVVVQDAAEATIPALEVAGKSEQVVTTGAQLFDVDDGINAIQHDDDGWITVNIDNTTGTAAKYGRYDVKPSPLLRPQTSYLVVCEIKEANAKVAMEVVSDIPQDKSQFQDGMSISTNNGYYQKICTTKSDFGNAGCMLRTVVPAQGGSKVSFKFRLSVLEDTSITQDTFAYQPYRAPQTVPIQLTAPLHGIGDVRDRIRLKDGEWGIERNIKIAVYDGVVNGVTLANDVWDTQYTGFSHCSFALMSDWLVGQKNFVSDTFLCTTEDNRNFKNTELSCHTSNNGLYLFISNELAGIVDGDSNDIRVAKVNTWIQSHNFKVMYDIATPTWEPFPAATQAALNALATYPGYTSITVDAGGPAAEISLDYVQDIKAAMAAQHQKIKAEVDEQLAYILSLLPESTQAAMIDTETNKLILESEELL